MIVCLSAGLQSSDGKYPQVKNGMYLGAQTRMDALVTLARRMPAEPIVVVGGYGHDGSQLQCDQMAEYVTKVLPNRKVTKVNSLPCTNHNIIALAKNKQLRNGKMTVLSSGYHLPRVYAFWNKQDLGPVNLVSAEDVMNYDPKIEFLVEFERRQASEAQGQWHIKTGKYQDSCKPYSRWHFAKDIIGN